MQLGQISLCGRRGAGTIANWCERARGEGKTRAVMGATGVQAAKCRLRWIRYGDRWCRARARVRSTRRAPVLVACTVSVECCTGSQLRYHAEGEADRCSLANFGRCAANLGIIYIFVGDPGCGRFSKILYLGQPPPPAGHRPCCCSVSC